jgi:hypothetical protein
LSTPVRRAVYGKMSGDSTLTNLLGTPAAGYSKAIYHQEAPAGAAYPYVIFNKQAGDPTDTFGTPSAFENNVWLVKGIDKNTTADTAEAIAARLIALLNDATLTISGATHLFLRRLSDVEYLEIADGVRYQHAGALFRLVYQ